MIFDVDVLISCTPKKLWFNQFQSCHGSMVKSTTLMQKNPYVWFLFFAHLAREQHFLKKHMGGSINEGTPEWMVYNAKYHRNGWFGGTPILGNLHMFKAHIFFTIFTHFPTKNQRRMDEWTGPQQLGESRLQAFPLDLRSENFWIMAWQVHPKFSDVSQSKKRTNKNNGKSQWLIFKWPEKSCRIPPIHLGIFGVIWLSAGWSNYADRPKRKIITFRASKKMIWKWCQICQHRTWGCNQWINGFLQNKNHQEWKDVKFWATCSNPPNLRVFLSLTNTHIPKIAGVHRQIISHYG